MCSVLCTSCDRVCEFLGHDLQAILAEEQRDTACESSVEQNRLITQHSIAIAYAYLLIIVVLLNYLFEEATGTKERSQKGLPV